MKNLTNTTRRYIGDTYAAGDELSILDLTDYAKDHGIHTATLSQHLRYLERDKILIPTQRGIIRQGGTSRIYKVSNNAHGIIKYLTARELKREEAEHEQQINASLIALLNWLDGITRARLRVACWPGGGKALGQAGLCNGTESGREFDGWTTEPNVGRVANGVAARVDRIKAIGNGQVSLVAATAFELLRERIAR